MGIEIQSRNLAIVPTAADTLVAIRPLPVRPTLVALRDSSSISPMARFTFMPMLRFFGTEAANFSDFFQGFHTGSDLKISAKGFVGSGMVKGSGKTVSLTADQMQMDLHIKSPIGNGDLNLDLRKEGDGYHLYSPQNWDATVVQQGNTLTVTNKTNPDQTITMTRPGSGEVEVLTKGFGYDKKTLVAKAQN
ncbi:MAG: hypothetical protein H7338_01065 [Candidatus Sericytochromatia bacterium]|nr:hypothetical protein [Candidatus Sericytochromatia bacterium]